MKIATWNVERPKKGSSRVDEIIKEIQKVNGDIIILTETNDCISLGDQYHVRHTEAPQDIPGKVTYEDGERRVSIFSKYDILGSLETFDEQTALCVNIKTAKGELAVYGTVIGIFGNREESFRTDLDLHIGDFKRIASIKNLCIAGDLNISLSDNYYFTKEGRDKLNDWFRSLKLENVTAGVAENIDHIVIPRFLKGEGDRVTEMNVVDGKVGKLSDHKGVCYEFGSFNV